MRNIFLKKQKSTVHFPRALPFLIWILALAGIIIWLYLLYYLLFIVKVPNEVPLKGLGWTGNIVRRLTFLSISASGIYILVRAAHTRATLYFALLVTYLSVAIAFQWLFNNGILPQNGAVVLGGMYTIYFIILVRTLQEFPSRLSPENIKVVFTHYPLKAFVPVLSWLLPVYRTWLVFLPLGLICNYIIPLDLGYIVISFSFGLAYLFTHLRIHNTVSKRPLYWMLWVVSLDLFWYLLLLSAQLFELQIPDTLFLSADVVLNLSLLFAFVMSVYLSDLVDAKLLLQKTVIYGAVIFVFTFLFGVAEHFVIHQLSHYLHLEDVYVASTFACIMGMFFHPLKKKLTHWMKYFDHRSEHEHVKDVTSETLNAPNKSIAASGAGR